MTLGSHRRAKLKGEVDFGCTTIDCLILKEFRVNDVTKHCLTAVERNLDVQRFPSHVMCHYAPDPMICARVCNFELLRMITLDRFEMAALFFGFVASHNFAVILIPVSRDSTLLAAAGVPYERAVLYHTIAGHLAFTGLLFHGLLYIAYWAWTGGWSLIVEESIHHPHDKGSHVD